MTDFHPDTLTCIRDCLWHVEQSAQCLRMAVQADPSATMRLGVAHAAVLDLLDLLKERTRAEAQ